MKIKQSIFKNTHPDDTQDQRVGNGLLYAKKLGIKGAAKMIGIGETKLREFIRNGELPALLIDGKYLLLEQDIEIFLQHHYGTVTTTETNYERKTSLPKRIAESELLRRMN